MKTVILLVVITLISACADNVRFSNQGCILPDGTIGINTAGGCVPVTQKAAAYLGGQDNAK